MEVKTRKESKYSHINPERDYPIGVLNDVEIQLLHYKSAGEAKEKWTRRRERINFDNCLIKMSNRSTLFTDDLYDRFEKLPFRHKIMFTKDKTDFKDCIYIEEFKSIEDTNISEIPYTIKKINLRRLLNGLSE